MVHGNKKYNFEELKEAGNKLSVQAANIYALKSSLRHHFGSIKIKEMFTFEDEQSGHILITRIK